MVRASGTFLPTEAVLAVLAVREGLLVKGVGGRSRILELVEWLALG